jgi:uncharacterized membrane protein
MKDPMLIGLVVLLLAVFAARLISERSYRLLTLEEKGQMMDAFSGLRRFYLVPLIVLVGGYWLLADTTGAAGSTVSIVYFGGLLVYVVGMNVYMYRKMKSHFPRPQFLRLQTAAQILRLAGIVAFLGIILWEGL